MNGFINLLKPPGMTSSDAVVWLRRRVRGVKLGHSGTLDPEASGVLPLMLGKATRLFDELADKDKEYIAEWMPGVSTDTLDASGRVVAVSEVRPGLEALRDVLPQFTGMIWQVPPAYSAIKLGGESAYARARRGEAVEIPRRQARIDSIDILEKTPRGGVLLRIRCGRGTYIRTLCQDIGTTLGCAAHMGFLLRTRSGCFDLDTALTLEELELAIGEDALLPHLTPMDAPLGHLPRLDIPMTWAARARCGNPVPLALVGGMDCPEGTVRLYLDDAFMGLGIRAGDAIRFLCFLGEV